jgi:hypothetical protein
MWWHARRASLPINLSQRDGLPFEKKKKDLKINEK